MKKVFILTLCFYGICLHAQDVFNRPQVPTNFTEDLRAINFIQQKVISRINTDKGSGLLTNDDILGSAYLEDDFKEGRVFYKDKLVGEYLLRYNVYGEEFEILNPDKTKSAVSKTSEVTVSIGDTKYVFKYYLDDDGHSKFGYFKVLSNDLEHQKYSLLKKYKKLFSESHKAVTSFDLNRPPRFVDSESYYILFDDKEIVKIRLKSGYIGKLFKKKGVEGVHAFIKTHRLNLKNIEDLKKVIDHFNAAMP